MSWKDMQERTGEVNKIEPYEITRRVLRVIILRGSMTPIQREALEAARARAISKGLGFNVIEF
jgi:hypothetical protein